MKTSLASLRAAACLLSACLLAACTSEAPRRAATPAATMASRHVVPGSAPTVAAAVPSRSSVADPFDDPRLDPIREKVPLVVRANAVTPAHLALDRRPTRVEKQAIRVWQEIRERLHQGGPQPSHQLMQTRVRVTRAIVQLYAGRLTYAGFAERLREIDVEHQAANRPRLGQR